MSPRPPDRRFHQLFFICWLFLCEELFRAWEVLRYYRISTVDILSTYCFLITGAGLLVGAGVFLLRRFPAAGLAAALRALFQFLVFLALMLTLFHAVVLLAVSYGLSIVGDYSLFVHIAGAVLFSILYVFVRRKVPILLDRVGNRTRLPNRIVLVAAAAVTLYCTAEGFLTADAGSVAAPPQQVARSADRPNVVLIVLESTTADDLSLYGYALRTTPKLDSLARSWTVFEDAHSSSNATVPSNISILTGRYPYFSTWSDYGRRVAGRRDWVCIPQIMKMNGFQTFSVQCNYDQKFFGFQSYIDRSYATEHLFVDNNFDSDIAAVLQNILPASRFRLGLIWTLVSFNLRGTSVESVDDEEYGVAVSMLRRRDPAKPFFLQLNTDRPHYPYLADEFLGRLLPADSGLADRTVQDQLNYRPYTDDLQPMIDKLRIRYDENIMKTDSMLCAFVDTLKSLGCYDNCLLIITSDHGEQFANGWQGHGSYRLSHVEHHVPLLVKFPHQKEGRRISGVVKHIDIFPTILAAEGIEAPAGTLEGTPLPQDGRIPPDRIAYVFGQDEGYQAANYRAVAVSSTGELHNIWNSVFYEHGWHTSSTAGRLDVADHLGEIIPYRNATLRFFDRVSDIRSGKTIQSSAPLSFTLPPAGGDVYVPILVRGGSELSWFCGDSSNARILSGSDVYFGGENTRSYTDIPVVPSLAEVQLHFTMKNEIASKQVGIYCDFYDTGGARIDLKEALSVFNSYQAQRTIDVLFPVPEKTATVRVAFKNPFGDERLFISDLSVTGYEAAETIGSRSGLACWFLPDTDDAPGSAPWRFERLTGRPKQDDFFLMGGGRVLVHRTGGKELRIIPQTGQQLTVKNLGLWHPGTGLAPLKFAGTGGTWSPLLPDLNAVNDNPDFRIPAANDQIEGYSVSAPAGVRYRVTSLPPEEGGGVRITALTSAEWIVLVQSDPLRQFRQMPVTIKGSIRSSGAALQELQLFDFDGKNQATVTSAEGKPGPGWNDLTIRSFLSDPRPNDYYSIGLFGVKQGDSFDIRRLSVYIGWLP
ncbi:MAG TPA: sulfatase [Bacteroidota bacterium]|nr:sulfatase [Bacteroidota bacterium]